MLIGTDAFMCSPVVDDVDDQRKVCDRSQGKEDCLMLHSGTTTIGVSGLDSNLPLYVLRL